MENTKIILDLDEQITKLEFLTETIGAIDMAMSEGSCYVGTNCLVIPYTNLKEISQKLTSLMGTLAQSV